jgi:hypothetical protein
MRALLQIPEFGRYKSQDPSKPQLIRFTIDGTEVTRAENLLGAAFGFCDNKDDVRSTFQEFLVGLVLSREVQFHVLMQSRQGILRIRSDVLCGVAATIRGHCGIQF